jgi:CRP-like cAMP-binding protein
MRSLPPSQQRLRNLDTFARCTDEELAFIDGRMILHRARAGEVLTKEGQSGRELVVIADGTAVVLVGMRAVARLGPGDVVGEMALLDHGPRSATVVAESDVEAFVSSGEEFAQILLGAPTIARALAESLARRLRSTTELLAGAGRSAKSRIG